MNLKTLGSMRLLKNGLKKVGTQGQNFVNLFEFIEIKDQKKLSMKELEKAIRMLVLKKFDVEYDEDYKIVMPYNAESFYILIIPNESSSNFEHTGICSCFFFKEMCPDRINLYELDEEFADTFGIQEREIEVPAEHELFGGAQELLSLATKKITHLLGLNGDEEYNIVH